MQSSCGYMQSVFWPFITRLPLATCNLHLTTCNNLPLATSNLSLVTNNHLIALQHGEEVWSCQEPDSWQSVHRTVIVIGSSGQSLTALSWGCLCLLGWSCNVMLARLVRSWRYTPHSSMLFLMTMCNVVACTKSNTNIRYQNLLNPFTWLTQSITKRCAKVVYNCL